MLTWLKDNGIGQFPDGENLTVIAQESDQRLVYRPGVAWRYNALETEVDGAQTRESVTLQQPLFSPTPWRYSSLLRFHEMIKEAFEPAKSCAISQLSAHLEIAEEALEEHLDGLHEKWRSEGVAPKDMLALAKRLGRNCYL